MHVQVTNIPDVEYDKISNDNIAPRKRCDGKLNKCGRELIVFC